MHGSRRRRHGFNDRATGLKISVCCSCPHRTHGNEWRAIIVARALSYRVPRAAERRSRGYGRRYGGNSLWLLRLSSKPRTRRKTAGIQIFGGRGFAFSPAWREVDGKWDVPSRPWSQSSSTFLRRRSTTGYPCYVRELSTRSRRWPLGTEIQLRHKRTRENQGFSPRKMFCPSRNHR